ncbi:hypothetical protein VPH35_008356 [Triticum aestivum]
MLDTATPRSFRPSLRRSSPPVAAAGPAPGPDLLLPSQRPSGPRRSRPGFLLLPPEIHSDPNPASAAAAAGSSLGLGLLLSQPWSGPRWSRPGFLLPLPDPFGI